MLVIIINKQMAKRKSMKAKTVCKPQRIVLKIGEQGGVKIEKMCKKSKAIKKK
jgi:hypothetical protein